DFERQSLADGLAAVGFAADRPTFFLWLGVVPFLTRAAIGATLDFVASAASAELVFDYSEPVENYPPERRAGVDAYAARAAAAGEPWLSHFDPAAMARELRDHGLEPVEDLGFADLADRYLGPAASGRVRGPGPHVIHARRAD
ncbi:MAG: class I SAM-dependent methyltransferase, partial [Rhodospirillales bacterium]|nr:class I SAM-dependent methyltransferase [Rhodospirillales bacterium]